jgi:hypothetical protein
MHRTFMKPLMETFIGLVHPRLIIDRVVAAHHTHSWRVERALHAFGRAPAFRRAGRPSGLWASASQVGVLLRLGPIVGQHRPSA